MKKSVIIASLVVILISGIVGLSTVFADSPGKGGPDVVWDRSGTMVMETGADYVNVAYTGDSLAVVQLSTTYTVHVSLTVDSHSMDSDDWVKVLIGFANDEGDDWHSLVLTLTPGDAGPKTIEFDATPAATGLEYTWMISAYDDGLQKPDFDVFYNYTMTYPKQ